MKGHIDIRVLGDDKLAKKIAKLDRVAAGKIVRPGMRAAAQMVLPYVKAAVPEKTGNLKRSIKVKADKRKWARSKATGVNIQTGTREQLGIAADDKYYYPAAVEYGHGNVPARSYLRGPMDQHREAAKLRAARVMKIRLYGVVK